MASNQNLPGSLDYLQNSPNCYHLKFLAHSWIKRQNALFQQKTKALVNTTIQYFERISHNTFKCLPYGINRYTPVLCKNVLLQLWKQNGSSLSEAAPCESFCFTVFRIHQTCFKNTHEPSKMNSVFTEPCKWPCEELNVSISKNMSLYMWFMVEISPLLGKFLQTDASNAFLCLLKFYQPFNV